MKREPTGKASASPAAKAQPSPSTATASSSWKPTSAGRAAGEKPTQPGATSEIQKAAHDLTQAPLALIGQILEKHQRGLLVELHAAIRSYRAELDAANGITRSQRAVLAEARYLLDQSRKLLAEYLNADHPHMTDLERFLRGDHG
ncbi:hypothetical protein IB275_30375 [Pseudomonas sp. PDM21]|uniref:hypothetical protein n=1 Tax=Pseudomonas sp. PDM21 TaxID=2769257 RepID=UPI00177AF3CB|nr:hypothetical protein [Pseudomonas sp. PDM21]MBD9674922.1 hypothetical protein [Pseudomonas sp. PDM21]